MSTNQIQTRVQPSTMAVLKMIFVTKILVLLAIFSGILQPGHSKTHFYQFKPNDILGATEITCLLLGDTSNLDDDLLEKLSLLQDIFKEEDGVLVGTADLRNFVWPSGEKLSWKMTDIPLEYQYTDVAFFAKRTPDRTCLYHPSHTKYDPMAEYFGGPREIQPLVQFINHKCNTFRLPDGHLSPAGLHRQFLLDNVFRTRTISDTNMGELYRSYNNPLNSSFRWPGKSNQPQEEEASHCDSGECKFESNKNRYTTENNQPTTMAQCDRIKLPLSQEQFFQEYLKLSRPVIIEGAALQWDAFTKWTSDFLREHFGTEDVHIKLTPGGDFEGVEPVDMWENYESLKIPAEVREALKYPDLVVVRPAGVNMKFSEFLDLIEWAAAQPERNVSAYLEYSSIKDYMPELQEDLKEFGFTKDLLTLRHLNIWLSDGNTLGRLHFDAFDNLLCQVCNSFYLYFRHLEV